MFRIVSQAVRQADPLQPVFGLGAGIGGAGQFERQHDVLDGIQRRQQLEGLENEAQQAAAQNRPRILVEATEILAGQGHRSRCSAGRDRPAGQQRGFPRAGGADDRHRLAGRDGERNLVQNGQRLATVIDPLGKILHLNDHRCVSNHVPFPEIPPLPACCRLMLLTATVQAAGTILVFGDSLSAGYGIRQDAAWPALLARRLQEKRLDYSVVNASISGETTSGGRTRIEAALARHSPQVVIVALGANDGLRGLPVAQVRDNLTAIVASAQKKNARVLLVGQRIPPNYGPTRCSSTRSSPRSPSPANGAGRLPARRRGDAGALFQADNLHPTAEAQTLLLDNVWRGLAPLLK
jgi:acyl-CoA thioesterase-1